MIKIYRKLNYRNIELVTPNDTGEIVGVWQASGTKYCTWLGTISRSEARRRGKPVKLIISRVDGYDLAADEYVHGCWTVNGVYAVIDVAIVRSTANTGTEA